MPHPSNCQNMPKTTPFRRQKQGFLDGARLQELWLQRAVPLLSCGSKAELQNNMRYLYIYWVHNTGIMCTTLQIAKTCLKQRLFVDKNNVFWMGLKFRNSGCSRLCLYRPLAAEPTWTEQKALCTSKTWIIFISWRPTGAFSLFPRKSLYFFIQIWHFWYL